MFKQTFEPFAEEMWITAVQVATVWTNPESAREIDNSGTENPTDIDKWIADLSYEESLSLCDENRVQTQLLYGEPVIVTETTVDGTWANVVIPTQPSNKDGRGYPGWVPLKQLRRMKKSDWTSEKSAAVMKDNTWLAAANGDQLIKLSYMTILPVVNEHRKRIEVKTPHGNNYLPREAVKVFPNDKGRDPGNGEAIVKAGEAYAGLDYFWGGMSNFGYDCSGLAYALHKANGYRIARDAGDQAKSGKSVDYDKLLPGDLLFFAYEEGKGRLHHVGIFYGEGKMLHSPQTGKGIEIIELAGTKYEKELCAARRYWHDAGEK